MNTSKSNFSNSKFNSKNPFYEPEALSDMIFTLLQKKSLQNNHAEVYRNAGITRANFSNYISSKNCPTPENARRLVIGLKCTIEEAEKLLSCCGYCLVPGSFYDDCLKECIINKVYKYTDVELYILEHTGYSRKDYLSVA